MAASWRDAGDVAPQDGIASKTSEPTTKQRVPPRASMTSAALFGRFASGGHPNERPARTSASAAPVFDDQLGDASHVRAVRRDQHGAAPDGVRSDGSIEVLDALAAALERRLDGTEVLADLVGPPPARAPTTPRSACELGSKNRGGHSDSRELEGRRSLQRTMPSERDTKS
jgi:hypothetical protein